MTGISKMELGYRFAPPEYPHAPGSPCLEINIFATPTLQHYDPEQVSLKIVSNDGLSEVLTLVHPWPLGERYRSCVGHVTLNDRKGNKVIAYTLGGELRINKDADKTKCILESEAPILQLGKMFEIPNMLTDEIKILIAKRAAACLLDLSIHKMRMAGADPFTLYIACLKALKTKYESIQHQGLTCVIEFRTFIINEIAALQALNRWQVSLPELEELI